MDGAALGGNRCRLCVQTKLPIQVATNRIHMRQKKAQWAFQALLAFTRTADLLQDYLDAGLALGESEQPSGNRTIFPTRDLFQRSLEHARGMQRDRRLSLVAVHAPPP